MGYLTSADYESCLKVLESIKKIYIDWVPDNVKCLEDAYSLVTFEYSRDTDQEVHSQVTLEMETGRDIPLTEWAFKNGIDASYARAKARRGGYLTAKKSGVTGLSVNWKKIKINDVNNLKGCRYFRFPLFLGVICGCVITIR